VADIIMSDDVHFLLEEAAEGTAEIPGSATDGYLQVLEPGIDIKAQIEQVERSIITSGLAPAKARNGIEFPVVSVPVELKGSGTEGTAPVIGVLFESLLGSARSISSNITTKSSGNTQTSLKIEDADIATFASGDIFIVKQANEHTFQRVTAITGGAGTWGLTVTPGRASGSFSNSVVLSKAKMYLPADSGHKTFTVGRYFGGEVFRNAIGCRAKSMEFSDFMTGKIPTIKVDGEGMTFTETNTEPGYTPTYETTLPPIVLNCKVYLNGTAIDVEKVTLKIDQPQTFLPSTASATGRIRGRASGKRIITGQIEPYATATSIAAFTALDTETDNTLMITLTPGSGTTGEFSLGNCFCIYIPAFKVVDAPFDQLEGVHREVYNFVAHGGQYGTDQQVACAFV
jgi:hypothetical protein